MYRNYGGMNQAKKMAEISSDQCHYGDINKRTKIKRNVSMYSERSYITEVFHGQRMFNTMTTPTHLEFENAGLFCER